MVGLRERKRAQTRLSLVDALIERLAERPLEEIQVRELAEAAQVSLATLFNYFPTKAAILTHFIQLWSLRMAARCRRLRAECASPLSVVETLFVETAEETAAHPQVMLELIAHQARMPVDLVLAPVEPVERGLLLPEEEDVGDLPDGGLGALLPGLLRDAIAAGELPLRADLETLTLATASVFFGVPLLVGRRDPGAIAPLYRAQLALLWAGAQQLGGSRR